jgi:cell division transport system permease protein
MRNFFNNIGYFLKEAKTIFRVDLLSNIFSIFSIGLIFFILSIIFSGWWISNQVVEVLQKEAELNVYYDEKIGDLEISMLIEDIGRIKGVREVNLVKEDESYNRMVDILGKESSILQLFDDNPFTAFVEMKIDLNEIDNILEKLDTIDNMEHVRDNKEVIDKLQNIVVILKVLGVLVMTAVGISTLVVVSHIIRQGIYNNREQINTLKLLGAPEGFIGFPFLLEGLFLTIGGGILASTLIFLIIYYGFNQMGGGIPFIPLPPKEELIYFMVILIMGISGALGIIGSLFGLSSAKSN